MSIFKCFFNHSYKITRIERYFDTSYQEKFGKIPCTKIYKCCSKCGKVNKQIEWSWLFKEDFRPEDLTETFRDTSGQKYI